ncbi:MAG: methyltransferase domain-containing protein [Leptolinea sp.]
MTETYRSSKAALRGEPSYVWRAGQERRLSLIQQFAGDRANGRVFVDGCGVGSYLVRLADSASFAAGLDIEVERAVEAHRKGPNTLGGGGEFLPFPANTFDLVLSHEVLEHVQDDHKAIQEIIGVLKPGGRLVLFVPNRGYPFETHGMYWHGNYHFGNIPLINYLPRKWRDKLAPHVDVYTRKDLELLFEGLPVKFIHRSILFGAYDNIIARAPAVGKVLRAVLQWMEKTPLRGLGLSHFWVIEKTI